MFVQQGTGVMPVCRSAQPRPFPWTLRHFLLLLMKAFVWAVGFVNIYVGLSMIVQPFELFPVKTCQDDLSWYFMKPCIIGLK
jgi:hypothetical protein